MEKEKKELNLFQKLLEIQKHVNGLGKNASGHGYDYVSGSKVLSILKPKMNDLGIILKQEILFLENTRQDYNVKSGIKQEILSKVMMRFTWVDVNSGEKDENLFAANGQNGFDKGLGSALTYAERYFLLKYFHIATDEDDIDNPASNKTNPVDVSKYLENALKSIETAINLQELTTIYNLSSNLHTDKNFMSALSAKKNQLKKTA